ncbi:MAG: hypothetical protein LQ349_000525, partial [Xanthoria aureola]
FFNFPLVSAATWTWTRSPRGSPVPKGYFPLPFSQAPTTCKITLDTLDDPNAQATFSIRSLAEDFRALYAQCLYGRVHGPSAGYIPVGPRQVMKLAVAPIRDLAEKNTSSLWTLGNGGRAGVANVE